MTPTLTTSPAVETEYRGKTITVTGHGREYYYSIMIPSGLFEDGTFDCPSAAIASAQGVIDGMMPLDSYDTKTSRYVRQRVVEKLINKELETVLTKPERVFARFDVTITQGYGTTGRFVRVYIGGYGDKKMLSSKAGQEIDTSRVVAEIASYAKARYAFSLVSQGQREQRDRHAENVGKLREELELNDYSWRDGITIKAGDADGAQVAITFVKTVSLVEARKLVAALKELA